MRTKIWIDRTHCGNTETVTGPDHLAVIGGAVCGNLRHAFATEKMSINDGQNKAFAPNVIFDADVPEGSEIVLGLSAWDVESWTGTWPSVEKIALEVAPLLPVVGSAAGPVGAAVGTIAADIVVAACTVISFAAGLDKPDHLTNDYAGVVKADPNAKAREELEWKFKGSNGPGSTWNYNAVIVVERHVAVTIAPATSWTTASSLGDGFKVRPKGGPPPIRQPGASEPRPAALAAPSADDPEFVLLYVKGADGRLWQNAMNDSTSMGWWPHEDGGVLGSAPSCVATGQPVIEDHEIYIRGTDGRIYVKSPVAGTLWVNTGWHELPGGGLTSDAPAAVTYQGRPDVFVRGMDDGLWENWRDEQGQWSGWVRHDDSGGVRLASAPSVIVTPDGHREVYVRGSDGAVYGKSEDGNAWSAWQSLGGIIQDAPCALGLPSGATEVYVRGMDDKVWMTSRAHHGSWSGFTPHLAGGVLRSGPAVISTGKGKREIFSIGPGGGAQYSRGANLLPE